MTNPTTDIEALAAKIALEIAPFRNSAEYRAARHAALTALRTIAQEAKPVAWMYERSSTLSPDHKETRVGSYIWPDWMQQGWTETPLYTHPSPAPQADAAVVTEGVRRSLKEQIAIDKAAVAALTPIQQELYNRELAAIDGNPGIVFPARPLPTSSAAPSDKDASDGEVERVARALCVDEGLDPDDDIVAGQAAAFENYGPRWQANHRSEGMLGGRCYVSEARAAIAALRHHDQENG